ncbi:uncharacterized protein BcabD6B2_41440 [Babesia caballi]|uniref:Uncharacterized protein n=1 Tax=Babesia caballi TaxID=5871 RepID=A0AAV4M1P1_BABCB|nr:hypothetical protein BcabD6B2_41440 [Babesia caballi]
MFDFGNPSLAMQSLWHRHHLGPRKTTLHIMLPDGHSASQTSSAGPSRRAPAEAQRRPPVYERARRARPTCCTSPPHHENPQHEECPARCAPECRTCQPPEHSNCRVARSASAKAHTKCPSPYAGGWAQEYPQPASVARSCHAHPPCAASLEAGRNRDEKQRAPSHTAGSKPSVPPRKPHSRGKENFPSPPCKGAPS